MSDPSGPWLSLAAGTLALTLFALDFALSLLLHAVQALSRVALRGLAAEWGRTDEPLEELRVAGSAARFSVELARQGCLLGACASTGVAAWQAGVGRPWVVAFAAAALAVAATEGFLARAIALRDPRVALRTTAGLSRASRVFLRPIVAPLHRQLRRLARSFEPPSEDDEEEREEEQIEAFIEVGEREGILEAGEGEMVRGIVDLGNTRVREIMTPRTDIVALPVGATLAEARQAFLRSGHSRLPVYQETIDNVIGILHVQDLLHAWAEGWTGSSLASLLRPAFFVPETRTVAEVLSEMRLKTHLALVVDEYGSLVGLVTLEDLVEEIVGEIREEHEAEEPLVQREGDGQWVFSGLAHVEELERIFGLDVGERNYDTVGGLVVAALGRVPAVGERFETHGLRIEVLEADRRRVYRVRVTKATGESGPARAAS